jgi:hypothetical protein
VRLENSLRGSIIDLFTAIPKVYCDAERRFLFALELRLLVPFGMISQVAPDFGEHLWETN